MKARAAILGMWAVMVFSVSAWGGAAAPVSPGNVVGTAMIGQNCPTFSWSAADSAPAYRLEVYEQMTLDGVTREQMAAMFRPVMQKDILAPALSWTPASEECLSRGVKYVWFVQRADAEGSGQWSRGNAFQVETEVLTAGQKDAVKEMVKVYLGADGNAGPSSTTAKASATNLIKTAYLSTPKAVFSSTINAYGDAFNLAVGTNAGTSLVVVPTTAGVYDTFIGAQAGSNTTSGIANTFVGYNAGNANTMGHYNTLIGYGAGSSNITGIANVFIGMSAGFSETGSNKLYIDNCYTQGSCTQPLIKGDFAARTLQIDGALTMVTVATPSDERYKKEIQPLESSLEKVMHLQGVSYEWKKDAVMGAGFKDGRQIGLIAQEVEKVLPELVHTDERGYKTLSYDKLVPVLIEAVKEQQKEMKEKEIHYETSLKDKDARIERLEKALEMMERRLTSLESQPQTIAFR